MGVVHIGIVTGSPCGVRVAGYCGYVDVGVEVRRVLALRATTPIRARDESL
jgi:hypothetical protein